MKLILDWVILVIFLGIYAVKLAIIQLNQYYDANYWVQQVFFCLDSVKKLQE